MKDLNLEDQKQQKIIITYLTKLLKTFKKAYDRSVLHRFANLCKYRTKNNCGCAIGIVISDKTYKKYGRVIEGFGLNGNAINSIPLNNLIMKYYHSLPVRLLKQCQLWHDNPNYFNIDGISELGYSSMWHIITTYIQDEEDQNKLIKLINYETD